MTAATRTRYQQTAYEQASAQADETYAPSATPSASASAAPRKDENEAATDRDETTSLAAAQQAKRTSELHPAPHYYKTASENYPHAKNAEEEPSVRSQASAAYYPPSDTQATTTSEEAAYAKTTAH